MEKANPARAWNTCQKCHLCLWLGNRESEKQTGAGCIESWETWAPALPFLTGGNLSISACCSPLHRRGDSYLSPKGSSWFIDESHWNYVLGWVTFVLRAAPLSCNNSCGFVPQKKILICLEAIKQKDRKAPKVAVCVLGNVTAGVSKFPDQAWRSYVRPRDPYHISGLKSPGWFLAGHNESY